jgi:hypothetical protein
MNFRINRFLFSQTNIDSGSLSTHSTIVHKFAAPGGYEGIVIQGSAIVGRFTLSVIEDRTVSKSSLSSSTLSVKDSNTASQRPEENQQINDASDQINIDLSSTTDRYTLKKDGYGVFFVSTGAGGYSIEINRFEKGLQRKSFDSKELSDGEIFSAMVIRPGTYSITNTVNNSKSDLVVNYPELGKMKKILTPINIECKAKEIVPSKINIDPSQGLIFSIRTLSRIKIELTKPEDRPLKLHKEQFPTRTREGEKFIKRYRIMPRNQKF